MTVSSTIQRVSYDGDDATREWPITFDVTALTDDDIVLYKVQDDGTATLISASYEIDLTEPDVTYPTVASGLDPLTSDEGIIIMRVLDYKQEIDYTNQGPLPAQTIEDGMDRLTYMCQQLSEEIDRCIQLDVTQEEAVDYAEVLADAAAAAEAYADAASASVAAVTAAFNAAYADVADDMATSISSCSGYADAAATSANSASTYADNASTSAISAAASAASVDGTIIQDTDSDTKIDTEENADEDIIRFDIGGTEQITLQDGKIEPTTDNDVDLGAAAKEFKDLYIDGTANIDSLVADTADINGGTLDGVQIGGTTATGELIVNNASDDADGLGSQGTAGQVLTSAGAGANPTWGTVDFKYDNTNSKALNATGSTGTITIAPNKIYRVVVEAEITGAGGGEVSMTFNNDTNARYKTFLNTEKMHTTEAETRVGNEGASAIYLTTNGGAGNTIFAFYMDMEIHTTKRNTQSAFMHGNGMWEDADNAAWYKLEVDGVYDYDTTIASFEILIGGDPSAVTGTVKIWELARS